MKIKKIIQKPPVAAWSMTEFHKEKISQSLALESFTFPKNCEKEVIVILCVYNSIMHYQNQLYKILNEIYQSMNISVLIRLNKSLTFEIFYFLFYLIK